MSHWLLATSIIGHVDIDYWPKYAQIHKTDILVSVAVETSCNNSEQELVQGASPSGAKCPKLHFFYFLPDKKAFSDLHPEKMFQHLKFGCTDRGGSGVLTFSLCKDGEFPSNFDVVSNFMFKLLVSTEGFHAGLLIALGKIKHFLKQAFSKIKHF